MAINMLNEVDILKAQNEAIGRIVWGNTFDDPGIALGAIEGVLIMTEQLLNTGEEK